MRLLRSISRFKLLFEDTPKLSVTVGNKTTFQENSSKGDHEETNNVKNKNHWNKKASYFGVAALTTSLLAFHSYKQLKVEARNRYFSYKDEKHNDPPDQSIITKDEVAKHNSFETGIWITYKGKVYNITEFVQHHPGGSHTIMMAAGGDVGPFWQTYSFHQQAEIQGLLDKYKIGILDPNDAELVAAQNIAPIEGPYSNDPPRSIILETHTKGPFNGETPAKLLADSYLTPTDIFFVRNHLPVPEVSLEDYKLSICFGSDGDPESQKLVAEFTLDELKKKFQPHTIDCVIQCSGNRRSDLKKIKEIKGLGWNVGAIGNARWTGIRFVDLLDSLNIKQTTQIKHIQMEGLDCDMTGQSYGASISADVAFDRNRDILLAYEINGQPLSRDHGFPLRFVAPGITGARNVKWLSKIILSHEESHSHWQRNDYKSFSPNIDMFNIDYKQSVSIQEMPVQSAICSPVDNERLHLKQNSTTIPVRGYAYSGGGKMIVRVDVSIDGGETWITADLLDQPKNEDGTPDYTNRNLTWSWQRWKVDFPIPNDVTNKNIEILCRAFDAAYNGQPERSETLWNARGVVNNSWHKVKVQLI